MKWHDFKKVLSGVVIGVIVASSGFALANSQVSATLADFVKFRFNGTEENISSGYKTFLYEDRLYVPLRFVAEKMGIDVEWDEKNKTVSLTSPSWHEGELPSEDQLDTGSDPANGGKETGKGEEVDQEQTNGGKTCACEEKDNGNYQKLPVTQTKDGVSVELYDVSVEKERVYFYIRVTNNKNHPVQLLQDSVYFVAENRKYWHKDLSGQLPDYKDNTWYRDIQEDEKSQGYVTVPALPEGTKSGTLHLEILQNDASQKKLEYDFPVQW